MQAPLTFVFAVKVNGWKQDLEAILAEGQASGAWPEATVNYFKTAVPQFQVGLGDKLREYGIKDAMIAATHLVLAAESLGLATCFMNGWLEEPVKAVIGVGEDPEIAIAVLVPVGYPAEPRKNPGRLPLASKVSVDRLGVPYGG